MTLVRVDERPQEASAAADHFRSVQLSLRSVCQRQVRLAIEKERMIDVIKDCLGSMSVLAVSCCGVMQEDLESDDWVVAAADLPAMLLMQSVSCGPARSVHSLI